MEERFKIRSDAKVHALATIHTASREQALKPQIQKKFLFVSSHLEDHNYKQLIQKREKMNKFK